MREYIITQLRECSFVRGKQKTWVSELNDDQLYELFQRLRNHETAKSIARYIQQAWGVNPESTSHSLSQGLLKFKKRISHLLSTSPPESDDLSPSFDLDQIDQLEDLESLELVAKMQRQRIHRLMKGEKETGVPYNGMSREVQALAALTKTVYKVKTWQMLHRDSDPLIRRRLLRMQQTTQRKFGALLSQISPDGKDRILEVTNKFLELLDENAMIARQDENGRWTVEKPEKAPTQVEP